MTWLQSLKTVILVPVVCIQILVGGALYYVISEAIKEFEENNIKTSLRQLSETAYQIADTQIDLLNKKGLSGKADLNKKVHQVTVFEEYENFSRQNNFDVIVLEDKDIKFNTRLDDGLNQIIKGHTLSTSFYYKEHKFYTRKIDFVPWNWSIILIKDANKIPTIANDLNRFYLFAFVFILLMTAALFIYLRRVIETPINQMVSNCKSGQSPEYRGIKEFQFLSMNIENMMYELARHKEHLEDLVTQRTYELKHANFKLESVIDDLEKAKVVAEEASMQKSHFLANMAHDIRSPLNAIIGFVRIVLRHSKDILPKKHTDNLMKVHVSANNLMRLVNHLLDYSRIETNKMPIHRKYINLMDLINQCIHIFECEPKVESGQIIIKNIPQTDFAIYSDEIKLKQIVVNLLSNAVKFTNSGNIIFSAKQDQDIVELYITDNGIGIPKKDIEKVFDEYHQVNFSNGTNVIGTGLGLAITRKLVHLLGGRISVSSKVNLGSTFKIVLPNVKRVAEETKPTKKNIVYENRST